MSPGVYEEWCWSVEFDPPATSLIRTTNELLALLIASYHNAHRGPDASGPYAQPADFLHAPDADDEDDDGDEDAETTDADERDEDAEAVPRDVDAARMMAAHEWLRSGLGLPGERRSMPLIPRPHATPVPEGLFALLMGAGDDTEGDDPAG